MDITYERSNCNSNPFRVFTTLKKKGFALCNEFETLFRFRTFMRNHHEDFSSIQEPFSKVSYLCTKLLKRFRVRCKVKNYFQVSQGPRNHFQVSQSSRNYFQVSYNTIFVFSVGHYVVFIDGVSLKSEGDTWGGPLVRINCE